MRARVQATLNELLPIAAGVLVPKGYALGDDYEFFGYARRSRPSSPTARCRGG